MIWIWSIRNKTVVSQFCSSLSLQLHSLFSVKLSMYVLVLHIYVNVTAKINIGPVYLFWWSWEAETSLLHLLQILFVLCHFFVVGIIGSQEYISLLLNEITNKMSKLTPICERLVESNWHVQYIFIVTVFMEKKIVRKPCIHYQSHRIQ